MKFGRPCPKCGGTAIELFESVRAGGGPLAVDHVLAGTFSMFSQFEAFVCGNCGYTEFYRK
jgi:predicted nucleic-acid-binding Zn-ribbon protein